MSYTSTTFEASIRLTINDNGKCRRIDACMNKLNEMIMQPFTS
jgi:hypothetical protein